MKKTKRFLAFLLTLVMFASMNLTVFAAETSQPALTEDTTAVNVASQANEDDGIMPYGIGGYAAKYTNPTNGSFTVTANGSGNGSGTFQITTHEFNGSPTINVVLYRPDGSYATQIYINGNGTKKATFSNAIPGTYEIVYGVAGVQGGWISAWVSS